MTDAGCRCWADDLERACGAWAGTPWQAGQSLRGVGVDCVRFVDAVLMQLHGIRLPPLPRLSQDQPLHDPRGVMRACRRICQRYPHRILRADRAADVEPGDVMIVRRGGAGGPGHVGIVARDPRSMWHALYGHRVCRSPVCLAGDLLMRVYRPTAKESWAARRLANPNASISTSDRPRRTCHGCGPRAIPVA